MSLDICSENHDEIVYQQGGMFSGYSDCPLCKALKEIEDLKEELDLKEG